MSRIFYGVNDSTTFVRMPFKQFRSTCRTLVLGNYPRNWEYYGNISPKYGAYPCFGDRPARHKDNYVAFKDKGFKSSRVSKTRMS